MVDPIYTDALIYASLLAMLAIGLTLTYITTRVPNFAHASVATQTPVQLSSRLSYPRK